MKKSKRFIAFFGPDGTGKTTTADLFEQLCNDKGLLTCRYHWRPRVLPSLKKGKVGNHDVTRPDELVPRSWFVSVFNYVYFFLDFVFAWAIKLKPSMRKKQVIIYERYYYDILFHPTRYKLRNIPFLGKMLCKIVPKPELVVLMSGDASVIYSRKPELSIAEIKRQHQQMENTLGKLCEVISIDATQFTPKECALQVLEEAFPNHSGNK